MTELLRALVLICQVNTINVGFAVSELDIQRAQRKCVREIFSCIERERPKVMLNYAATPSEILRCL